MQHRRAQIIDAVAKLCEQLLLPPEDLGFPIQVKTVQKQFRHWTSLDKQGAIPAILLLYGSKGSAPDSEAVGFIDEVFPIPVIAVLKEGRGAKAITDQASDIHYSIGRLINGNRTLGVEGVIPEKTKLETWDGTEERLSPFLLIKFRVVVVHRYHATESV